MLQAMVKALAEMYPHIPACMHQDHGNNQATCMTAIQYGFTSVMMDGSLDADAKTLASYDYNLGITRQVTEIAHHAGVSVEGELGVLGSLETGEGEQEDGHGAEGKLSEDQLLTDPDQAVDFVVDAGRQVRRPHRHPAHLLQGVIRVQKRVQLRVQARGVVHGATAVVFWDSTTGRSTGGTATGAMRIRNSVTIRAGIRNTTWTNTFTTAAGQIPFTAAGAATAIIGGLSRWKLWFFCNPNPVVFVTSKQRR